MENGKITDAQLSASSARFNKPKRFGAHRGRLNIDTWPSGWSAKTYDPRPWIQIDFGIEKMLTGISTQGLGHSSNKEWVKTYKIATSDDGITWFVVQADGREKVWDPCGENDKTSRFLRILQFRITSATLYNLTKDAFVQA